MTVGRRFAYKECFAAQKGVLGASGQHRLRRARVLVAGIGGLGSIVCCTLANAGVGTLIIVDRQRFAVDNFNRFVFARPRDIGKPKVDVLAAFLEGRPHLSVIPIFDRFENVDLDGVVDGIDLIVSTSNTIMSRVTAAQWATQHRVPHIVAGVADGREMLAGTICAWVPEQRSQLACAACFLRPSERIKRGESLMASVIAIVGATAAAIAMEVIITDARAALVAEGNLVTIDVQTHSTERIAVRARPDCEVCGNRNVVV